MRRVQVDHYRTEEVVMLRVASSPSVMMKSIDLGSLLFPRLLGGKITRLSRENVITSYFQGQRSLSAAIIQPSIPQFKASTMSLSHHPRRRQRHALRNGEESRFNDLQNDTDIAIDRCEAHTSIQGRQLPCIMSSNLDKLQQAQVDTKRIIAVWSVKHTSDTVLDASS